MYDATVYFVKINETWAEIRCQDFDFVCLMRDHFSFFADGYRFHPAFKAKAWDGKIRMLQENGRIHLGLWHEVVMFCQRHNHPFKIDPQIQKFNLPAEKLQRFVDALDPRDEGDQIPPYEYQFAGIHRALEWQRALLLSPTSSGKSLIQYVLIQMYRKLLNDEKMLMVVPTVALVSQMADDFANYASHIEFEPYDHVHQISSGVDKNTNKQIIIGTYQSLAKYEADYFNQFKVLMVDEVHTATAKSIIYIVENCINAFWRVGLTGTFDECKTNLMTLKGLFGPVYEVITLKELMEFNRVAQLDVEVMVLEHLEKDRKFLRSAERKRKDGKKGKRKANYAEEIEFLVEHKGRNDYIINLAIKQEGNTVVMINKIEHGEYLYKRMKEEYPDRDIYLYTGATKASERVAIRDIMEQKENAIIIGSLGVLSTGISIKRLHNMVFAHPSKSRVKVLQSVGRLLRKSKHGNHVRMLDLVDDFTIGAYENYTYGHGQKRLEFYTQQQFNFKIVNIKM